MKTLDSVSFDEMYNGSFYTIIGAGGELSEWVNGYEELLAKDGIGKPEYWATFKGHDINDHYDFEGNNRFQEDLNFLVFPLDGLNVGKLALFRLRCGDKWFDDLVNNSVSRKRRRVSC